MQLRRNKIHNEFIIDHILDNWIHTSFYDFPAWVGWLKSINSKNLYWFGILLVIIYQTFSFTGYIRYGFHSHKYPYTPITTHAQEEKITIISTQCIWPYTILLQKLTYIYSSTMQQFQTLKKSLGAKSTETATTTLEHSSSKLEKCKSRRNLTCSF